MWITADAEAKKSICMNNEPADLDGNRLVKRTKWTCEQRRGDGNAGERRFAGCLWRE